MKGACYIQLFFLIHRYIWIDYESAIQFINKWTVSELWEEGKKDFSKHTLWLRIKSISQVFRNYYLITYLYCLIFKVFYAHKQQKQGAMFSFDKLITKHFGSHA